MATHRLTRIGYEGFALIDECYGGGRTGRSAADGRHQYQYSSNQGHHQNYQPHQLQPCIYHGPQISTVRLPVVVSNEVAQHYGSAGKEPAVMTSDEAAEYYGGVVIMEYGRRKHFRKP
ncbi:conserved hypothetical protein [Ricinus communis]|uniref:Uncharacterized protein n=1 Tax=Ricinus communis TaxID=3988 RepID=B9RT97_RICCO|nr:conserved hypothetical protein [Ricinus communis]